MSDLESLTGKRALVTGAAKRLGRAVAERLAREGAHLVLHHRSSPMEVEDLRKALECQGVEAAVVQADLSNLDSLAAFLRGCIASHGPLDYLVNCASIFEEAGFAELDAESLRRNVDINALSPTLLAREFASQGRPGAIVNFLDTMIMDYDRKHVPYHLSKRMFATLNRIMAVEFAPAIRVNAVAPGLVLPPEGKGVDYLEALHGSNLLQRHGSAEGIGEAVVFLLRSGFITGQTIYLDGGRHMRGAMYE
ncbi:MAG: SDR family oxidoreductase [Candidatus Hydrogenedentes bacterium]|nr:SDR family oxidoreductase [Candidatus Hydrogenedentota bacterium]